MKNERKGKFNLRFQSCFWLKLTCMRLQHWDSKRDCYNEWTVPSMPFFLFFLAHHMLLRTWHWHHHRPVLLMLFSAKLDKIAFAVLSPVVLSRSTWSKNTYLILGETSLFRSKNIRQTLNISWFAYLSATSSPMIEKKVSSFWISCITFARIYSPVMQMTSSCTVFEMLVAFLLPVSVLEDFYQSCPIA